MMAIVIDSTVAVAWLFEDESGTASEAALDRLRNDEAVVPSVWHLEVTNALLVAEANRKLTEAQAAHLLVLLAQLPITIGAPMQVALDVRRDGIPTLRTTTCVRDLSPARRGRRHAY
jgi:predicted nucleic acid-binding protein